MPKYEGGLKLHVSNIDRVNCRIATSAMLALDKWADPSMFTHAKPEPPDSWERIEEDLSKSYTEYWGCRNVMCNHCPAEIDGKKPHERFDGCSHNCVSAMRRDIVRRCKALAGVSD